MSKALVFMILILAQNNSSEANKQIEMMSTITSLSSLQQEFFELILNFFNILIAFEEALRLALIL